VAADAADATEETDPVAVADLAEETEAAAVAEEADSAEELEAVVVAEEVDLVVETEMVEATEKIILTVAQGKCTKRSAQTVKKNARSLSNQHKANRSIAETVFPNIRSTKISTPVRADLF